MLKTKRNGYPLTNLDTGETYPSIADAATVNYCSEAALNQGRARALRRGQLQFRSCGILWGCSVPIPVSDEQRRLERNELQRRYNKRCKERKVV